MRQALLALMSELSAKDEQLRDKADELEKKLKSRYFIEDFKLRDGMEESRVYFKYDTFRDIFPEREPDFDPGQSKE